MGSGMIVRVWQCRVGVFYHFVCCFIRVDRSDQLIL